MNTYVNKPTNKMKLTFYMLWLFLSAFTKENGQLGNVIYADLVGAVIIFFGMWKLLFGGGGKFLHTSFFLYTIWLCVLSISCVINYDASGWVIEYIKLVYLFCMFISLYMMGVSLRLQELREYCSATVLVFALVAALSFVDFAFIPFLGNYQAGGLVGGFRNTGQAGTYFSIGLILSIAFLYSGAIKQKKMVIVAVILIFVALVATSKRAALLGSFSAVLVLYVMGAGAGSGGLLKRTLIGFVFVVVGGGLVKYLFGWGLSNIEGVEQRVARKFGSDFDGGAQNFLFNQVHKTGDILIENPFFGAGSSGSIGFLGSMYEVHNGYLKVLVISGIVGAIIFIMFFLKTIAEMLKARKESRMMRVNGFVGIITPLFIGYSVAWGYTFPLRKREFWLLLAFIYVFMYFEKKYSISRKETSV